MNFIQGSNKLCEELKRKMIDMSIIESNYGNDEFIAKITPMICRGWLNMEVVT